MSFGKKGAAILMAVGAGCLWGTTGFFVRHLNEYGLNAMQLVFVKMSVSAVLLGLFILIRRPGEFKFRLRDFWLYLLISLLGEMGFNLAYITAMEYCTLSLAVSLLYASPIVVVLASAFIFNEAITPKKVFSLIAIVVGCCAASGLFSGALTATVGGIVAGVLAAVTYSTYNIFSHLLVDRGYSPLNITFYAFFLCVLEALPFTDVSGLVAVLDGRAVCYCLCLGIICCMLPYVLFTFCLKQLESGQAAMLTTSETVVVCLISVLVFKEPMTVFGIIGILLIIFGNVYMNARGRLS